MAQSQKIRFSRTASAEVQYAFVKATEPIDTALQAAENSVNSLRDWWEGDSADAFVEKFSETRKNVKDEVEKWLDANKQLMKKIEERKFSNEQELGKRIRGV